MSSTTTSGNKDKSINAEKTLTKAAEILDAVARPLVKGLTFIIPILIKYIWTIYDYYQKLPNNVVTFLIGFVFCFFGGLYPTLFAAVQAAEHSGRATLVTALKDIMEEILIIINESKKDDSKDDDGDGKADVDQVSGKELILRKGHLIMTKINPEKVDRALGAMYRVWLSVVAVLTLQFARTINLAVTIADFLNRPMKRHVTPTVQLIIPDEYDKWVPVIMGWCTKSIGISIAWAIQTVISAVTSALAGGRLMAHSMYKFCKHRGYNPMGLMPPNEDDSFIDEIVTYVFVALGVWFQFSIGFKMPFPLNLLLWPFELAEWYIRWTITNVKQS